MSIILPIGKEAAAARTSHILHHANEAAARLALLPDNGNALVGAVRQALQIVLNNPTDVDHWADLDSLTDTALNLAHDEGSMTRAKRWWGVSRAIQQGRHVAGRMHIIAVADAPVCRAHGPMVNSARTSVPAEPHGDRWICPTRWDCPEPYWWLDGTFIAPHRASDRS